MLRNVRRHRAIPRSALTLLFVILAVRAAAQAAPAKAPAAPAPKPSPATVGVGVAPSHLSQVADLAFSVVVVDNTTYNVGTMTPSVVVTRTVPPAAAGSASRQTMNPCGTAISFPLQVSVKNEGSAQFVPLSSAQALGVHIGAWGAAKDLVTLGVGVTQTMSFNPSLAPGKYTLQLMIDLKGQVAEARSDNKALNWPLEVRCQVSANKAAIPAAGVAPMTVAAKSGAPMSTMSSSPSGNAGAAANAPASGNTPVKAVQGSAATAPVTNPPPKPPPPSSAPAPGSAPVKAVQGSAATAPVYNPPKPIPPANAPAPASKTGGSAAMVDVMAVFAPSGLGNTQDEKACGDHGGFGGAVACHALLPAGALALVWNCPHCNNVIGYHLYRVDGGQHTMIASNDAYVSDRSVTLAILNAPGDGFNGKCYAVTAYSSSRESALSNAYCAGSGSVLATMTLNTAHTLVWQRERNITTGTFGHSDKPTDQYSNGLEVGYALDYFERGTGDGYVNTVYRSGVYFDLSPLQGKTVSKAVLQLVANVSYHGFDERGNNGNPGPQACVTIVDKATDTWWTNNDLTSTQSYLAPGRIMGPKFSIDVTSAIQNWVGYGKDSNYGFVLRGENENDQYTGKGGEICLTQLASATLVVTYH
jgi:hypothetical protein